MDILEVLVEDTSEVLNSWGLGQVNHNRIDTQVHCEVNLLSDDSFGSQSHMLVL